MKKTNTKLSINYRTYFTDKNGRIVFTCGSAHSLMAGDDIILFSYVENGAASDVYYCTFEVFNERFTQMSKY